MRPAPGEVLHFSEDPTIRRFSPHVAPTSVLAPTEARATPYVWAVGHDRAPDYWFPRQCPRAMAWAGPGTTSEVLGDLFSLYALSRPPTDGRG